MGHFNSHAHVERDGQIYALVTKTNIISTHTLTWSVTKARAISCAESEISTHTLTWSVTGK